MRRGWSGMWAGWRAREWVGLVACRRARGAGPRVQTLVTNACRPVATQRCPFAPQPVLPCACCLARRAGPFRTAVPLLQRLYRCTTTDLRRQRVREAQRRQVPLGLCDASRLP